jgi:hypothetical protein
VYGPSDAAGGSPLKSASTVLVDQRVNPAAEIRCDDGCSALHLLRGRNEGCKEDGGELRESA